MTTYVEAPTRDRLTGAVDKMALMVQMAKELKDQQVLMAKTVLMVLMVTMVLMDKMVLLF